MPVRPIPDGYHSVTPYLIVKGAAKAIDFYKNAFGATELMRFPGPNNTIMHAEIKIGDSPIMLADEYPAMGYGGEPTQIATNGVFDALCTGPQEAPLSPRNCA